MASHLRDGLPSPQTPFIHTGSRLLIPEAYALVDAAVDDIVKIECGAACHIRARHEYHDMAVGKILDFGGVDVKLA